MGAVVRSCFNKKNASWQDEVQLDGSDDLRISLYIANEPWVIVGEAEKLT